MDGQPVTIVEDKWVQCDSCGKWRKLPQEIDLDTLPEVWTCEMNTYDPERQTCADPEEVATAGGN